MRPHIPVGGIFFQAGTFSKFDMMSLGFGVIILRLTCYYKSG